MALSFIGLDPGDTTAEAVRLIDMAHDWPSFQAALKLWHTPEQNIVYADVDGHIGFTSVGMLPLRKRPTDDFPAPGSTGEADWIGVTDFSQLPQASDPANHRFVNANNRVVPADFPIYVGRHYESPFRAERIEEMLGAGGGFTAEDFTHMQQDAKEQDTTILLPRLLAAKPESAAGQQAIALLRNWTGMMDRDRPEPLIYAAWVARLQQALLEKRLGGATANPAAFSIDPFLILRLLDRFSGASGAPDEATAILTATLDDTLSVLGKAYGQDIDAWRWGAAHPAALTSQLLGSIPVLGKMFDVGMPASGGNETVNRGAMGRTDGIHFLRTYMAPAIAACSICRTWTRAASSSRPANPGTRFHPISAIS